MSEIVKLKNILNFRANRRVHTPAKGELEFSNTYHGQTVCNTTNVYRNKIVDNYMINTFFSP